LNLFASSQIDGSAPKSYGPHVASMAGLSEFVLLLPSPAVPLLTSPPLRRAIVERAIGISKQFEESSRARERLMRANETLPLTAQADAAFLLKLARLSVEGVGLNGYEGEGKKAQLRRTMETMRTAVEAHREHKGEKVAAAAAVEVAA
jgi:DNA mismatch repair protein MSH6